MELNLISILIKNFMSFGNNETVLDFSSSGLRQIVGFNHDKGGSNGAGKSTIINVICFALYGIPFYGEMEIKKLINDQNLESKSQMLVEILFKKNGTLYKITRSRSATSSSSVKLQKFENDEFSDISLGKGVIATDKMIVEILGMSYKVFCLTQIFSGSVTPFLNLKTAEQREIIEQVFSITELTDTAENVKKLITEIDSAIQVEEAVIRQINNSNTKRLNAVLKAKQDIESWSENQQRKVAQAMEEKNLLTGIDFDVQQELIDFITSQEVILNTKRAELTSIQRQKDPTATNLRNRANEIQHLKDGTCPFCNQQYTSEEKKNELEEQHRVLTTQVEEFNTALATIKSQIEQISGDISEAKELIVFRNASELNQARTKLNTIDALITNLNEAENPYLLVLSSLSDDQEEIDASKIDSFKAEQTHLKLLLKLLTNKDSIIRTTIIGKKIRFLNERINFYSRILDLPHSVVFDSNLSCIVSEFGRELSFSNISSGERTRINLAISIAFRDVIALQFGATNILLIDEIDGGSLDQPGCEGVVECMRLLAETEKSNIWVITHNPIIQQKITKLILVERRSGFSSISIAD